MKNPMKDIDWKTPRSRHIIRSVKGASKEDGEAEASWEGVQVIALKYREGEIDSHSDEASGLRIARTTKR